MQTHHLSFNITESLKVPLGNSVPMSSSIDLCCSEGGGGSWVGVRGLVYVLDTVAITSC